MADSAKQSEKLDPPKADEKKVSSKKPAVKKEVKQVNLISLPIPYGGVPSNHRIIPVGVWRENDPLLLGLGAYLVSTKHATVVGKADPYPEAPPEDEEDESTEDSAEDSKSAEDEDKKE